MIIDLIISTVNINNHELRLTEICESFFFLLGKVINSSSEKSIKFECKEVEKRMIIKKIAVLLGRVTYTFLSLSH